MLVELNETEWALVLQYRRKVKALANLIINAQMMYDQGVKDEQKGNIKIHTEAKD